MRNQTVVFNLEKTRFSSCLTLNIPKMVFKGVFSVSLEYVGEPMTAHAIVLLEQMLETF